MDPLVAAAIGVALFAAIATAFVFAVRRRAATAAEADSSDDETSGPLSVNVVADHDEQDSLLPKFAGLLRSPWHSVSAGRKEQQKQHPQVMRPVRKGSRSMSLTMPLPLPLRKKRKAAEVPVKKVHVPYFFPLLDETAEWWQTQQPAAEPQPTPEEEPADESGKVACNPGKEVTHAQGASSSKSMPPQQHFAAGEVAATPMEVEGR
ncbi:uncharacterized protein IUM83_07233 [Phytophthora cinnamomi]|uniref:uncharacterized protein n=1 Tax=Phytophthora cinnamomi TaxID=4785 RepID=UPI0035594284|nr:hypothetical protein IUM83_07233 [Phytophthora cinnamomi]